MRQETLEKIRAQQGKARKHVWHCGEHVIEFLEDYPQYEDIIAKDLDNPGTNLEAFEKKIHDAASKNGNGLGGKAADAVLREFFGLPAKDGETTARDGTTTPAAATAEKPAFDFSGGLF